MIAGMLCWAGALVLGSWASYRAGCREGSERLRLARLARAEARALLDRVRQTHTVAEARLQESRALLAEACGQAAPGLMPGLMPVHDAMGLINRTGPEAVMIHTRDDGLCLVATRKGMCLVSPVEWELYRALCDEERRPV